MKRHPMSFAPEVAPQDLESPTGHKHFGGGKMVSMAAPPNIQPYQSMGGGGGGGRGKSQSSLSSEGLKKAGAIAGAIWLGGMFLGYSWLWPVYLLLDLLGTILSIPPISWIFGWIWTPLSWIFSWAYKGAPLVEQVGALQELRLPTDQISAYMDHYVNQYGDAALIFATHDGYPQLVNGLLLSHELGYADLIDATDDNGNTALIYAAAKGYRQCTAALLRHGADPDIANQGGGGRTPLMEGAGSGNKDIVAAIRLSNATIDAVDDFGNTALHYAAYHGHLSVVHELLKGNPRRDIKNSYGHTPASYALSNKHKAIADLLNRAPSRREKAQERAEKETADEEEELLPPPRKPREEKHVKGAAEELHKRDSTDFAPKVERSGISDRERKALEDQIAKLKRQHEEAELKAQKRIVELLERSASQQKAVEDAEHEIRVWRLNTTELSIKVKEFESKHQSSELRMVDERQRADRLHEEMQRAQLDAERHKSRAEGAERERDMHADASRRHEESLRRKTEEVSEHVARIERQSREVATVRADLRQREEELRQHRETMAALERELRLARSGAAGEGAAAVAAQTPALEAAPASPTANAAGNPAASGAVGAAAAAVPGSAEAAPQEHAAVSTGASPQQATAPVAVEAGQGVPNTRPAAGAAEPQP